MSHLVVATIFNLIPLTWIMDLDKKGCSCANDWRRKVLKYWYMLAIILPFALMLTGKLPKPAMIAIGLLGTLAFVALLSSLWDIERQQCRCAQDWREKVLLFTTVLSIIGVLIKS